MRLSAGLVGAVAAATISMASLAAAAAPERASVSGNLHAGCHSPPPWDRYLGTQNTFAVQNYTSVRTKISEVANGRLYRVPTNSDGSNGASAGYFYVAHVWGTPKQWGLAQGQLYGSIAFDFFEAMWKYMQEQVDQAIPHFPKFLRDLIETYGLEAALGMTYEATKGYTDPRVFDEMRGLAEGCGQKFSRILYMHMIAGLTQGKCSMFGAWGDAVAQGQGLLQLRALDWDMDAPVRNYSAVTVYHTTPGSTDGHPHALVGMVGFAGALSGMSASRVAISEIGVSFPDPSFGKESRIGKPFIFILREILAYDNTIDDAISRLATSKRTCDLILGVGDGKLGEFRSFEYSSSQLHVIDDENLIPANSTWHPKLKNVVYHGMDWMCPSFNYLLHKQLKANYGQLTAETAIRDVSALEQSGDNHIALYSLGEKPEMYVSFSSLLGTTGKVAAYDRQFTRLDMDTVFAEPAPQGFAPILIEK